MRTLDVRSPGGMHYKLLADNTGYYKVSEEANELKEDLI